jgi:hypothetical protein
MPAITLIRLAAPLADAATYVAVPATRALDVLTGVAALFAEVATPHGMDPADVDVNTMPWETLPGIEPIAAAAFAGSPDDRRVVFIGTVVAGQWTSWYPPCPACLPPPTQ